MRTFFILSITLTGCGTWGGEEDPNVAIPCDVLDESVVDTLTPTYALQSVDDLLLEIEGEWPVEAYELDDSGPHPGVLTVTRREGEIRAQDLERGEHTEESFDCSDRYLVPMTLRLELEDGLFTMETDTTVSLRSGPWASTNDGDFVAEDVIPIEEVQTNGELDMEPFDGHPPTAALLWVEYADGDVQGGAALQRDNGWDMVLSWGL